MIAKFTEKSTKALVCGLSLALYGRQICCENPCNPPELRKLVQPADTGSGNGNVSMLLFACRKAFQDLFDLLGIEAVGVQGDKAGKNCLCLRQMLFL